MGARDHHVVAYYSAAALVERVTRFVAASLEQHVPVVTISRPGHRHAVEDMLARLGIDVGRAGGDGTYVGVDADETMSRFMVDGRPDPDLFAEVVASLMPRGGRSVSAFGEMVSLLWERGELVAALELESLWNAAIAAHPVHLLCAYAGDMLADARLSDVATMCNEHDHVSIAGPHLSADKVPTGGDVALSRVHLPVPASVASVRRFVRHTLTVWGLDDLVDDMALVASELATNSITHGRSPFQTSLERATSVVRVAVEDGSSAWPERHNALPHDQDGRGMEIVASLSRRSGCDSTPHGKIAWAELSL